MCGIIGYIGNRNAVPLLLDGLERLEYRGYDSAGISVLQNGRLETRKCKGRLAQLRALLRADPPAGAPGIGHTRWATHGEPSDVNAHPHTDMAARIAVVHNGIVENYLELRKELEASGVRFRSETDTEVIPHLIARELQSGAATFLEAFRRTLQRARGAYALAVLYRDEPHKLYAARSGSPLILGIGNGENFVASDVPAIVHETSRVVYLNDGEVVELSAESIAITDLRGHPHPFQPQEAKIQAEAVERAGFETFMLKEIHEQPRVLRSLLAQHLRADGTVVLPDLSLSEDCIRKLSRIMMISCGTAYHAGLYGKLLLENLTTIAVETDVASEFRYRNPRVTPDTLLLTVSQSGETADTLASVRLARSRGCRVLSICNVHGSTLTRESDAVFYTEAGPEIGVASTKAYTAQLLAFCLITLHFARIRGEISSDEARDFAKALGNIPDAVHYVLARKDAIRAVAEKHYEGPSSLYLGRRYNYPTALEGALKNKEISYQHAEGYAAGEMKHGPIALINEYLPVICLCTRTDDEVYDKMLSNMKEVQARHGRIIAIATDGDDRVHGLAEDIIYVPDTREELSPIVNVVALQLLAYYAAQARGTDIDKPRNLAKSVTVE
jgi:glucosamine--fructose-6-phosphate aminotransferase (isomerizing)